MGLCENLPEKFLFCFCGFQCYLDVEAKAANRYVQLRVVRETEASGDGFNFGISQMFADVVPRISA